MRLGLSYFIIRSERMEYLSFRPPLSPTRAHLNCCTVSCRLQKSRESAISWDTLLHCPVLSACGTRWDHHFSTLFSTASALGNLFTSLATINLIGLHGHHLISLCSPLGVHSRIWWIYMSLGFFSHAIQKSWVSCGHHDGDSGDIWDYRKKRGGSSGKNNDGNSSQNC